MVQVHFEDDLKMPSGYKVVTNYDSMFSDLPQYPSHSYVPIPNGLRSRDTLEAGTSRTVTSSSSGLQVTGKDRALFFRRPVLQMSHVMPLPHIRYTRELSLSVEDVSVNDERRRLRQKQLDQLRQRPSSTFDAVPKSHSRQPRVTFGTQTDFRESETQTLPCSLESSAKGELGALAMLKYGKGLPVQTSEDLAVVDKLREHHEKEKQLPPKGDPRRPILQRKMIESKYLIEMSLQERSSAKVRNWKVSNMKAAVDSWADYSAQQLEHRLDRIWKHKQKEKDERMRKIKKIHEKEIKALERKCSLKNERLYGRPSDRRRQEFREALDKIMQQEDYDLAVEPHQHYSTSADIRTRRPPSSATAARPRTTAGGRRKFEPEESTDSFLATYNGLRSLERQTSQKMDDCLLEVKGRTKSCEDVRSAGAGKAASGYVPRNQKFNHLLDTAYDEILVKKAADRGRGTSTGSRQLYESFRPMELLSPKRMRGSVDTPSASDDEDEEALQRRLTLEKLHAEERGRANQLLLQKYDQSGLLDESDEVEEFGDMNERAAPDGQQEEAKVEAFLDEIEGETLGQMLNYLSSELESSDDADAEVQQRRAKQIDHVFSEISKVTQAAVDRYVDGILLNTIYKKAGQKADKETETKFENSKLRRASTSDLDQRSFEHESIGNSGGQKIKRKIKEFQKKHLLAAHEALWGVLAEMRLQGEINRENRQETEENIREALKSLMKPEEVEDELRRAIEGLNLEEPSVEETAQSRDS